MYSFQQNSTSFLNNQRTSFNYQNGYQKWPFHYEKKGKVQIMRRWNFERFFIKTVGGAWGGRWRRGHMYPVPNHLDRLPSPWKCLKYERITVITRTGPNIRFQVFKKSFSKYEHFYREKKE